MKKTIATIFLANIVLVGFAMQNLAQAGDSMPAAQECDNSKPETTPYIRYKINQADGTAFDSETKLTWKICAEGQIYSDGRCTDKATDFNWYSAMQHFGGQGDDWRLPNDNELSSIVEKRCQNPTINLAVFPDTTSSYFWTSSSDSPYSVNATYIEFYSGKVSSFDKNSSYYLRLVRSVKTVPVILRDMDKDRFCVAYGEAMRGDTIHGVGKLSPDIVIKHVKTEARRRKLQLDDSLARKGHIKIGISKCQLYASWGMPNDDNESVGRWGVHVQHVYGSGTYVYTENGRVTSWQD